MVTYIFLLIVTLLIGIVIEKKKNIDKKITIISLVALSLILAIFGGIRSINIGWDAQRYVVTVFNKLSNHGNFFEFMKSYRLMEFGFRIFSFILFKICPNINFLLFGYSLATVSFFMWFVYRERAKIDVSKALFAFYIFSYILSFLTIRQLMSLSIFLVAFSFFRDKKYIPAILLSLVTISIHYSAIVIVGIYGMYWLFNKKTKKLPNNIKLLIIITGVLVGTIIFFNNSFLMLLKECGILPVKYYYYMVGWEKGLDFELSNLILHGFFFVLYVLYILMSKGFIKKVKLNSENSNIEINDSFMMAMMFFTMYFDCLGIIIAPIRRIGYYFFYIGLYYMYPMIKAYFGKNEKIYKTILWCSIALFILYFMQRTFIGNAYAIYPYHSDIIPWLC